MSVGTARVGKLPQAVVEEPPTADVQFVVLAQAVLDVGESGSDAVLVPLESRKGDGVGATRMEVVRVRERSTPETITPMTPTPIIAPKEIGHQALELSRPNASRGLM